MKIASSHACFKRSIMGVVIVTGIFQIGWTDVGPDILIPLANGDREAMRRIEERVSLAADEGNVVAQVIVHEAKFAQGMDYDAFYQHRDFSPFISQSSVYDETLKDWLTALEKKAVDGDPFFMAVMGYMNFEGCGVPKDKEKGVVWWKKAAELNSGLAKSNYGRCLANGDSVTRDLRKAAVLFREAGELEVPWGWWNLGCLYFNNEYLGHQDLKKALECWAKSAFLGHSRSQYQLGFYFCFGDEDFPQNKELGLKWMRAAASNGHHGAMDYISNYVDKISAQRTLPTIIDDKTTDVAASFIAFDKIKESLKEPKVSVVCLVDAYEFPIPRPANLPNKTPSNMLDIYLNGLRTIKRQSADSGVKALNPDDVKIFIVECREDTRARAREFNRENNLDKHDGSIPVIYVFHMGRLVETYTYMKSPGPNGEALKSLVERLLMKEPKE